VANLPFFSNDLLVAAKRGDKVAQFDLEHAYTFGFGVAQDYEQAAKWYELAAEQGSLGALNNLGNLYAAGLGVARDDLKANHWYRRAADRGYAEAQVSLGQSYAGSPEWTIPIAAP